MYMKSQKDSIKWHIDSNQYTHAFKRNNLFWKGYDDKVELSRCQVSDLHPIL